VIAYFLLGERLNGVQLGGSLMILMGVVFLRVYEGQLENKENMEHILRCHEIAGTASGTLILKLGAGSPQRCLTSLHCTIIMSLGQLLDQNQV